MNQDEIVVGFDARDMSVQTAAEWNDDRRNLYLLRQDVEAPLSVDHRVWPRSLAASRKTLISRAGLDLWSNLEDLEKEWRQAQNQRELSWIIAVTLHTYGLTKKEKEIWNPRLPTAIPGIPGPSWRFLGYDIADLALLSCLANCGYAPEAVQALREEWGSRLNELHLISESRYAQEFKTLSNRRVPEHAPFFVYGLYVVPVY